MSPSAEQRSTRRFHPLGELILARLREFCREPAAIFWVYVFPLIMVVALGVAFRSEPSEEFKIAVHEGPQALSIREALEGRRPRSAGNLRTRPVENGTKCTGGAEWGQPGAGEEKGHDASATLIHSR